MVDFFDIVVENGIFRARAYNHETKQWYDVVAKIDGSYHNCNNGEVIRATWNIVVDAEDEGGVYPRRRTICWG